MITTFISDESGAITVDWVVLTASIVGIAIAVLLVISGGISTASGNIRGQLAGSESVASLITGETASPYSGNISDYENYYDEVAHDHYRDEEGNEYTVDNTTGVMTDDSNGEIYGTVDDDGNITPAA